MLIRRHALFGLTTFSGLASGGLLVPEAAARSASAGQPRRPAHHDRRPLVLLDPGHGGKDPGCIGLAGMQEKHVALAVALSLRRQLLHGGRYRVAMTRETDVFIPLHGRVEQARRLGASLLVSLHANASPDRRAHGTCVYRFAWRASDAHAASLARWENRADSLDDPGLRNAPRQVLHILALLMRRETQVHSARLQRAMVEHLRRGATMLPIPQRHARFAVLSAPDIAAVLIEMGFLTNRREEMLLGKAGHRLMLAAAMSRAVDSYFAALSPARSRTG